MALLEGQPVGSFEGTFGPVGRELAFEFDQFLAHLGSGFRADLTAEGTWRMTADGAPTGPEGDPAGCGRLVGALFANFTLAPEFAIGSHTSWIAPADGLLMLRPADAWTELADNAGTLSITIRRGEAP